MECWLGFTKSASLTHFATKINAKQFLTKSQPISWLETRAPSTLPRRLLCRGIFAGFTPTNPKIRKYTAIKEKLLCRLVSNLISTILCATAPFPHCPRHLRAYERGLRRVRRARRLGLMQSQRLSASLTAHSDHIYNNLHF